MKEIKLSQYAKLKNRCYRTMWNKFHEGLLPNAYADSKGSIFVKLDDDKKDNYCVIYARVSSHDQKQDLERQVERLSNFAINNGYSIKQIYKEIASGLNDDRKELNKLLNNDKISLVIVENKDRLTRFGFNYISLLLTRLNVKLLVVNDSDSNKNDLMNDFISIVTSFCARIYGQRRTKNNVKKIIQDLEC